MLMAVTSICEYPMVILWRVLEYEKTISPNYHVNDTLRQCTTTISCSPAVRGGACVQLTLPSGSTRELHHVMSHEIT